MRGIHEPSNWAPNSTYVSNLAPLESEEEDWGRGEDWGTVLLGLAFGKGRNGMKSKNPAKCEEECRALGLHLLADSQQ